MDKIKKADRLIHVQLFKSSSATTKVIITQCTVQVRNTVHNVDGRPWCTPRDAWRHWRNDVGVIQLGQLSTCYCLVEVFLSHPNQQSASDIGRPAFARGIPQSTQCCKSTGFKSSEFGDRHSCGAMNSASLSLSTLRQFDDHTSAMRWRAVLLENVSFTRQRLYLRLHHLREKLFR